MSYGTITVTTSATLIINANTSRKNINVVNASDSTTIFIGPDSNVTTSNGIPLYANQSFAQFKIPEGYLGPIYGIVSTGTADARYWEMT